MKILLALPPAWDTNNPSLGISYISAALKARNHTVVVRDYNVEIARAVENDVGFAWEPKNMSMWEEAYYYENLAPVLMPYLNQILEDIAAHDVEAVGFSLYITGILPTKYMMGLIRQRFPQVKIFCGGPTIDIPRAEMFFRSGLIDAAVVGEGELSAAELIAAWESADGLCKALDGVYFTNERGEIVKGAVRPLMSLAELPTVDFSDYQLSLYKTRRLPFLMSRGCVAKCNFCSETFFWKKYRYRPAGKIFHELQHLIRTYNVNEFWSHDSLMNGNHEVLEDFVDRILESGTKITWGGYCRFEKKLTDDLLEKMGRAGCTHINFGMESGSQKVLHLMDKRVEVGQIYRIVPQAHRSGISVAVGIIVGYPGEGWFDYSKTLKVLFDLRRHLGIVCTGQTMNIPRNTKLFENLEKFKVTLGQHWSKWRTRYYTNTIYHRKARLWFLRKFLSFLQVSWN